MTVVIFFILFLLWLITCAISVGIGFFVAMKRKRTTVRAAPPASEQTSPAAKRIALEYANFLNYDGKPQDPIDIGE